MEMGLVYVTDRLPFNMFVALTTCSNIVLLALEQELADMGKPRLPIWNVVDCLFVAAFAVEIVFRCYIHRLKMWIQDLWNVLDLLLVVAFGVDAIVFSPMGLGGFVRYFTVVRALRLVHLIRLMRMRPAFREMWLLVGGLVNSVKALGWIAVIIIIFVYVFAIVATTQIGQNPEVYATGPSWNGEDWPYKSYFGTVSRSMFSLLQILTLDGWCESIVRHIIYRAPFMGVVFMIYMILTAYGLMNVVVGIIVENTLAAAQVVDKRIDEKLGIQRKLAVDQLYDILDKLDGDRTGSISLEELQAANQSEIVQDKFKKIGLTISEVEQIFKLLDVSRTGRVALKRFVESCRELVGGAKRRDIAQVEITMGALAKRLEKLDANFKMMENEIGMISTMSTDFVNNTVRVLTGFGNATTKEET